MLNARFMVVVLSMVSIFLAFKLAARPSQQPQGSATLSVGPIVASDADIQMLRQDLRSQKQKLISQNLPMTESEAIKFWAVYNRYSEDLRQFNDEKLRLVKQYNDSWDNMTNEDALIYTRRWLEVDTQAHQLRSKYVVVLVTANS